MREEKKGGAEHCPGCAPFFATLRSAHTRPRHQAKTPPVSLHQQRLRPPSTPPPCSVEGTAKCIKIGTWYVAGEFAGDTDACDPVLCKVLHDTTPGNKCKVPERKDRVRMRNGRPAYWFSNLRHSRYLDQARINLVSDRCPEFNPFDPTHPYWKEYEPWSSMPAYVPQWSTVPDIHPVSSGPFHRRAFIIPETETK